MVKNNLANAGAAGDSGLIPGLGRSPGGGNGSPFQYSFLENPKDREVWWAIVHGVVQSWTPLSKWACKNYSSCSGHWFTTPHTWTEVPVTWWNFSDLWGKGRPLPWLLFLPTGRTDLVISNWTSIITAHSWSCIHVQSFLIWVLQHCLLSTYQESVSLDFASPLKPAVVGTGGDSSSLSLCPGAVVNYRHFMILSDGLLVADWFLEQSSWEPQARGSCLPRGLVKQHQSFLSGTYFPDSPVIKTPCCPCRGCGFNPWSVN